MRDTGFALRGHHHRLDWGKGCFFVEHSGGCCCCSSRLCVFFFFEVDKAALITYERWWTAAFCLPMTRSLDKWTQGNMLFFIANRTGIKNTLLEAPSLVPLGCRYRLMDKALEWPTTLRWMSLMQLSAKNEFSWVISYGVAFWCCYFLGLVEE